MPTIATTIMPTQKTPNNRQQSTSRHVRVAGGATPAFFSCAYASVAATVGFELQPITGSLSFESLGGSERETMRWDSTEEAETTAWEWDRRKETQCSWIVFYIDVVKKTGVLQWGNCGGRTEHSEMGKTAAKNIKLIPHRWAMHAVHALAQRDAALLTRVFTQIAALPSTRAIDTQVKTFPRGAALQFHDFGFFDASASTYSSAPLLDRVVQGDTLLLLALRRLDPACARALLDCDASLEIPNDLGETPLEILFDAYCGFQIHKQRQTDPTTATPLERTPAGNPFPPLLNLQPQYEKIFERIRDRLHAHHVQIRAIVEAELDRIYAQHAPERLGKMETQLHDFEFRELELLTSVKRKYEA